MKNIQTYDIKKYIFLSIIFLSSSYFVLIPFLKYETWLGGHDSTGTIFNAWSMVKTLREDFHLPLYWQPDNCGYKGNPYWAFYQPLSYAMVYFSSIFTSLFDRNYLFSALKLAVYLSFLISEIGMYFLLRSIFRDSKIREFVSVYGAIIYLLSPYRFIDLYSRNAYSELWVFPWMPLYFLGFYKLFFLKEKNGWILITISTPLLVFSHLMPSFFFILIVTVGFLFFKLIQRNLLNFFKEDKLQIIWWFIGSMAGGAISLLYILPAMNVIKYINGDIMGFDRVSLDNVLNHISWCYDMLDLLNFKGSWQVGQTFLISFFVLNFLLLTKRKSHNVNLMVFLNILVIITFVFLMSRILWAHVPAILYSLQFSWRLFLIYSFFCSIILALLINELNLRIPILILILAFHFYTGERFLHYGGEDIVAKYYDVESWLNTLYKKHFTTTNNYSPRSILPKTSNPVFFNFDHADQLGDNERYSNTYLMNLKPGINILSHEHLGNTFIYELSLDCASFLIFKQFFYPSWELYIDSKKSDIYLTEKGYIGFEVPKGKHIVKIRSN